MDTDRPTSDGRSVVLPNLIFFDPWPSFVSWLTDYSKGRMIVDAGAGVGRSRRSCKMELPVCRVVIVDDDLACLDALAEIAAKALGMNGTVEAYSDVLEFLDAVRSGKKPDLLLVDYVMPAMDGIEALRILRGSGVQSKAVIVSAFPLEVSHKLLPTNNVSVVVAKPFVDEDIEQVVLCSVEDACELVGV